jgi:hypothetical protein
MTWTRVRRGLGVLAVGLALAVSLRAEIIDRVLAIVGGQVITLSEVHAAMAVGLVEQPDAADPIDAVLQGLIERRLIAAEVDRYAPPEPGEAVLAARAADLMRRLPADPAQRERLGLDPERVRAFARDEVRAAAYLDQRFGVVAPGDDEGARRRAAAVAAWMADLRRRTDVSVLYLPKGRGRP